MYIRLYTHIHKYIYMHTSACCFYVSLFELFVFCCHDSCLYWLVCSFIFPSFIHSFIHSFNHSFMQPLVPLFILFFRNVFIYLPLIWLFISLDLLWFILFCFVLFVFIRSLVHSSVHSFVRLFIGSFIHSVIHSFIHWFLRSCIFVSLFFIYFKS